jgi:hypothetical protein
MDGKGMQHGVKAALSIQNACFVTPDTIEFQIIFYTKRLVQAV